MPFGVPDPKKKKADGMGGGIPVRARRRVRTTWTTPNGCSPNPPDNNNPQSNMQGIPKYDPNMILHGEQSLELLRPLPAEGEFTLKSKVLGVWDKGTCWEEARGGGDGVGHVGWALFCALDPPLRSQLWPMPYPD